MQTTTAHRSSTRTFLRHYAEMVLAMLVGMAVLGMPLSMVLPDGNTISLANMGVSMTLPMVAWMHHRGHRPRISAEMAAAMLVPTLAAIAVDRAGLVSDFGALMMAEHVVMLAAMAGAMLLRPAEYLHHAPAPAPAVAV